MSKDRNPFEGSGTPKPIPKAVSTSTVNLKEIHYIGMKPSHDDISEIFNNQVLYALEKITDTYPYEVLNKMKSALENDAMEEYDWRPPTMPYHITSNLINGKVTMKTKKAIEEFKIGIGEKLDINCIVIVENLFVVSLHRPKFLEISAKIPYMSLWMNGAKPKDCTKILEHLLYQVKPSIKHGEERLRVYYSIMGKSILKDDVIGEIQLNFDKYGKRKVWYCFIKDSVKISFESFIKKLGEE